MRQSLDSMPKARCAPASLLTNGSCGIYTLNWASLEYQHLAAIQAALLERYSPATAKKMMCAMRRVLGEARKLGMLSIDSYNDLIDLPPIKESNKLRGRALSQEEIAALVSVCHLDPTAAGVRDLAAIAILRGTGLRRAELVKLEMRDYQPKTGALQVRGGKGGKECWIILIQINYNNLELLLEKNGNDESAKKS